MGRGHYVFGNLATEQKNCFFCGYYGGGGGGGS